MVHSGIVVTHHVPQFAAPNPRAEWPITSSWLWLHRGRPWHILDYSAIPNGAGFGLIRSAVNWHGHCSETDWEGSARFYVDTGGYHMVRVSFRYRSMSNFQVVRVLAMCGANADGPVYRDRHVTMQRLGPSAPALREFMLERDDDDDTVEDGPAERPPLPQ